MAVDEQDRLAMDMDAMDPTLQPGTLVSKDREAYSNQSYQRLIQDRTKTTARMIYDIVLNADVTDKRSEIMDRAIMLGSQMFNAPGTNRLARLKILEDEAEDAETNITGERAAEIDTRALEDAQQPRAPRPDGYDVRENIYYGIRKSYHSLRLEVARDRESGRDFMDFSEVKQRLYEGATIEEVIDDLPVMWRKVLSMTNASIASSGGVMRTHVERMVANVADAGGGEGGKRGSFMGKGRGGRGRKRRAAEDSW